MDNLLLKIYELFTVFGIKVIAAIAIFIFGRIITRILKNLTVKLLTKSNVEATLITFIGNLVYFSLLTFVIIAAIGQLGIQTTFFIAVLGAAGLAVGLALQGSLSNFAAGIMLIIFRPFKTGDFIEAGGTTGTVEEIQVFTTILKTPDNKAIIIPNSKLSADNIINYSAKPVRRIDFVFGIGYGDDIDHAKKVINDVLLDDERILKDPPVTIGVLEHGNSSVNIAVRPWVKSADYWNVYFNIM